MTTGLYKKGMILVVICLFMGAGVISSVTGDNSSFGNTIYVDDDNTDGPWDGTQEHPYNYIQNGVDAASNGDTVFVHSGTYYEHHIIIDKKISLVGEDKNSTVINAVGEYKGIEIYHDDVVVKGFTIGNNSYKFDWWYNSLMEVKSSKNVIIENNIFISDYDVPDDDNRICGICLIDSTNCFLQNNSFYGCNILIFYLDHFETDNSNLEYFFHDIDTSNKVNEKPVHYYKNCEHVDVPSDAGQVIFVNTSHSTISGIENDNTSFNILLFYSNNNTVINSRINDSLSGFWLHYSNYNIFENNTVNRTSCSLFLWQSNYNFFQNNVLPSTTVEQFSDHNIFIKNHIRSSRTYDFSIQLESSDYNVFKCNNIYGRNFITGRFIKENKSVQLWVSHFTIWDKNYWGDCFRENNKQFTKYFPKIIVGLHRGIYVHFPKINFPSIINFDWHPAQKPYEI